MQDEKGQIYPDYHLAFWCLRRFFLDFLLKEQFHIASPWCAPQGSPHLLLCYAWQTLWHEAGTYLAHLRPRKTA
jgi:hypothetical protein